MWTRQGCGKSGGSLVVLDVVSGEATPLLDNWQGQAFNSPNDVCVGSDGSVWFTDPDAGAMQVQK